LNIAKMNLDEDSSNLEDDLLEAALTPSEKDGAKDGIGELE